MLYSLNKLVTYDLFKHVFSIEFFNKYLPHDFYNRLSQTGFIQKITSREFLDMFRFLDTVWYTFPLGILGLILFMTVTNCFFKNAKYRGRLKDSGFDFNNLRVINTDDDEKSYKKKQKYTKETGREKEKVDETVSIDEFGKLYKQTLVIKNRISLKISSSGILKEKIDSDIEELLEKHMKQIRLLVERNRDINALYDTSSVDEIEARLEKLKVQFHNAKNESLKSEYGKSIKQCEHHRNSFLELSNQKEILYLKLSSAVMSLKQLEVDMANMKEIITNEEYSSLRTFEDKSNDLSNYVDNLKQSYRNLERELE